MLMLRNGSVNRDSGHSNGLGVNDETKNKKTN